MDSDLLKPGAGLSVMLCTHNPDIGPLQRALEALDAQSLPKACWELILVDNASDPALAELGVRFPSNSRIVREERPGLLHARLCGLREAMGEVLVFVDDDNRLDRDYLANAQAILADSPAIGAVGGIVQGEFESTPPHWTVPLQDMLALRDFGPQAEVLNAAAIDAREPIGAGMVVRASALEGLAELLAGEKEADNLGRRGTSLAGGEDTLIVEYVKEQGFATAYHPRLHLIHEIPAARLRLRYLCRLARALGASHALLALRRREHGTRRPAWRLAWSLVLALRVFTGQGLRKGLVRYCWKTGYYLALIRTRYE